MAQAHGSGRPATCTALPRPRRPYPFRPIVPSEAHGRRSISAEQRRAMILDTQRYLNNPRSRAWPRRNESPD